MKHKGSHWQAPFTPVSASFTEECFFFQNEDIFVSVGELDEFGKTSGAISSCVQTQLTLCGLMVKAIEK